MPSCDSDVAGIVQVRFPTSITKIHTNIIASLARGIAKARTSIVRERGSMMRYVESEP